MSNNTCWVCGLLGPGEGQADQSEEPLVGRADRRTADAAAASGSQCVICAFCSQNLLQQISQLISELEENRGFHFMELEDEELQPIDEKARSVDKSTQ